MARYKHIDTSPRFLAVDLRRQLLPGTFEHAMNYLIDNELAKETKENLVKFMLRS